MKQELDIIYEDTGNHLHSEDICNFTTFKVYYDKLNLEKYGIHLVSYFEQENTSDHDYDIYILRGKVENILQAYDDIDEHDFYSEEPVAFFYQKPLDL